MHIDGKDTITSYKNYAAAKTAFDDAVTQHDYSTEGDYAIDPNNEHNWIEIQGAHLAQGGRPLSALARDRKYTSQEEWEKAYTPNRKSKVMRYKTKEQGGTAAQETYDGRTLAYSSEDGVNLYRKPDSSRVFAYGEDAALLAKALKHTPTAWEKGWLYVSAENNVINGKQFLSIAPNSKAFKFLQSNFLLRENLEEGGTAGEREYSVTLTVQPKKLPEILQQVEDLLQVSSQDDSMFDISGNEISIYGLTQKEEYLLMEKFKNITAVENIQSTDYAQGGRPKSAIMRDRYNTNASEPWEVNYARKTRARNRAEGGSAGKRYSAEVGEEQITVIKNKKEVTGFPVYARITGYAPVTVDVYPTKEEAQAKAKKLEKKNQMQTGGAIKNQYHFKTPQQVWEAWTTEQRIHFLMDHKINPNADTKEMEHWAAKEYRYLSQDIIDKLFEHVMEGQYNYGGEIDELENIEETYEPDWENDDFIEDKPSGGYSTSHAGKFIGEFETTGEALAALKTERAKGWFPTIWFVSDHGNYWAIDENGNEIKQAGGALGGGVVPFFQSLDMSKLPPNIRSVVEPVATHKEIIYVREGDNSFEKFLTLKNLLETKFPDAIKKPEVPKPAAPKKPDVSVLKTRLLLINEMMKKADAAKKAILKTRASIVREMIASAGKKEEGGSAGGSLKVKLLKKVKGLPYKVGQLVPVSIGKDGNLLWHVHTTIIDLPKDSYELESQAEGGKTVN